VIETILFSASWCGPCKTLKKYAKDNDISFTSVYDIDTEEGAELSALHGIRGVPTVITLSNSTELSRFTGMNIDKLNKIKETK
tara:strand:+ start:434 stop:682 length:249 start_codon:yes stop_codon:yes gene_type:complete